MRPSHPNKKPSKVRQRNQWFRGITPTQFIEKHYSRKAPVIDFETSYAKRSGRALRDTTKNSQVGSIESKRLYGTEKTILHIHPTYSIKPAHEDSLVRQIALNLSKQRKPSDPIPKKGTKVRLFFDIEKERKRTDFQRPLPSARDLVRFFSLKQVKTDALIIMDSADPTKVAGYLFMRKLKSPPIQFESGLRTEILRRSLLLARVGDLKSKKPVVRKSAEKELVGNYPYLFKGLVKPLRKRDITADFLKGVFKDLEKLGVKSRLVPNKKNGYAYVNGQFIKRS